MQKYNQYCPVAQATEIFADRWTPLIVRELISGSDHFNEIERGLPGISRSLLASRLRELEASGVLEKRMAEPSKFAVYHLTESGRELKAVIEALGAWGVRWAFGEPELLQLDAPLLVWKMHQRINRELLPEERTVLELDFTGPRPHRAWLVLERREVSVCVTHPGFEVDLILHADLAYFYRVWFGEISYDTGLRSHAITLEGLPRLAKQLPQWLMWSPMSRFVREREAARQNPAAACSQVTITS